jgi:AcrR family transcriptional regulator
MARWKNTLQTDAEIQQLKRKTVIREAGRAFSSRGFHNTSLDDVAKALNVAKGTLYNYVRDKQEILYECHILSLDVGDRALEIAVANGKTGAGKLNLMLTGYVTMLLDELGACAVLTQVDALRPQDRRAVVARRDAFEKEFVGIIEEGIADGTLRQMDRKLAVFTFMGVINWMTLWYRPGGRLTPNEIGQEIARTLMCGMSSPTAAAPADARKRPRRKATLGPAAAKGF